MNTEVIEKDPEQTFKDLVKATFGLEYQIYKEKLAYLMVIWADGSDGTVAGPFAGHGHNCRVAYFEYHGWAYAYHEGQWWLLENGQAGWRKGDNPFPQFQKRRIETW